MTNSGHSGTFMHMRSELTNKMKIIKIEMLFNELMNDKVN